MKTDLLSVRGHVGVQRVLCKGAAALSQELPFSGRGVLPLYDGAGFIEPLMQLA